MKKLARIANKIEGQPMFKLLAKAKELERRGKKILHFEIGDPDFNTPRHIIDTAYRSMTHGETHYTNSMGLYDFRVAVCEATLASRGFKPSLEQVLVTPGANIIIYLAVKCLVNPGDEVILPDPGFPTYYSVIKFCEATPIRIPLKEKNDFRMNPEDIRKKITSKTKLIIINSPSNPTGGVMTSQEIDEIYSISQKRGIYLLSDEVYSRMMYDNCVFHSASANDACQCVNIVLNGFSKAFAMTGWRLGVAIGPENIIEKMGLLIQTLCSCVPPFIQRAGVTALKHSQSEIRHMVKTYKERRDILVDGLNKISGISCLKPKGAFYVFPNIKNTGMTSEQFTDFMLEKAGVALLPGSNFGKFGQGYVRLCYATSLENIKKGIRSIRKALLNSKK